MTCKHAIVSQHNSKCLSRKSTLQLNLAKWLNKEYQVCMERCSKSLFLLVRDVLPTVLTVYTQYILKKVLYPNKKSNFLNIKDNGQRNIT